MCKPALTLRIPSAALAALKDGLRDATLAELRCDDVLEQRSGIVLLAGSLHTSGRAASVPTTSPGAGHPQNPKTLN